MKTARMILLLPPDLKDDITARARSEGVSVAELVRSQFSARDTEEEKQLSAIARQITAALKQGSKAVDESAAAVAAMLATCAANAKPAAKPAASARKAAPATRFERARA